jgi:alpha-galactosidase
MKVALNETGRAMVYSINNGVQASNTKEANLWRTTPDTSNTYPSMIWTAMVNNNASTQVVAGRAGAWNDADMLEVGNFYSEPHPDAAGRTNLALWCLMKSPLILGTDLTNLTAATLRTLTAEGAIAVSKDPLAEQGVLRESPCYAPPPEHAKVESPAERYGSPCGHQVWSGALSHGGVAAVLTNLESAKALDITLTSALLPPSRRAQAKWVITDAYTGRVVCAAAGCVLPRTVAVPPNDVAFWVMRPAVEEEAGP